MKLNLKNISLFAGASLLVISCSRNPDSPGYEYMPDMYRSQAVEAYVDYGLIKDVEHEGLKNTMSAKKPAEGTIPFNSNPQMAAVMMPYSIANSDEGYEASKMNQIPMMYVETEDIAKAYASEGKVLFGYFCSHCHGKTGQGDGAVVTYGEFNTPQPYNGGYKDRTLGQIFHVITYGKGAMGPHGSQLNKDERWKVALYVRTMQHGDLAYADLMSNYSMVKDSMTISVDTLVMDIPAVTDHNMDHTGL